MFSISFQNHLLSTENILTHFIFKSSCKNRSSLCEQKDTQALIFDWPK